MVELNIVDRASDNTISRTLKKHTQCAKLQRSKEWTQFCAWVTDPASAHEFVIIRRDQPIPGLG